MKRVWERPPGTAMLGVGSSAGPPFGYPPRLRSGLRQNRAGFLEKREKGRPPGISFQHSKTSALSFLVIVHHLPRTTQVQKVSRMVTLCVRLLSVYRIR